MCTLVDFYVKLRRECKDMNKIRLTIYRIRTITCV